MGNQPPPIIQTSTDSTEGKTGRDCPASARSFHLFAMSWTNHANGMTNWKKCWSKNSCLLSLTAIYPLVMTNIAMENQYRQLRAGNLEGDSRTPTGVLQSFSQGGGPGDQLDDVRTLAACVGGVSGIISWGIRKMILEPLHFGAFLLSKNKVNNCT